MSKIRFATIGLPRFVHEGLEFSGAWQEFDFDSLPPEARTTLFQYVGTHIQVHPDDEQKFRDALANAKLEYVTEPDGRRRVQSIGGPPPTERAQSAEQQRTEAGRVVGAQPDHPEQVVTDAQRLGQTQAPGQAPNQPAHPSKLEADEIEAQKIESQRGSKKKT